MKDNKAKNLLLIVLLIIVIILTAAVVYNVTTGNSILTLFNTKNKQDLQVDKEIIEEQKNEVENEEVVKKEPEDTKLETSEDKGRVDVKNIKWSRETDIKDLEFNSDMHYFIENGKLKYYNLETNKEEIVNIKGTPKYLTFYVSSGMGVVALLTQEGDVYGCNPFEGDPGYFGKREISEYKVKEFAFLDDYAQGDIYYLLENGKIINSNGLEYDTFQESIGYMNILCFKEGNLNIWHIPDVTDTVEEHQVLKDMDGNVVEAKTVYWRDSEAYEDEEYIIITKDNEILHYNLSEYKIVKKEDGKVNKVKVIDSTLGKVEFECEENKVIVLDRILEEYIVVENLQKKKLY